MKRNFEVEDPQKTVKKSNFQTAVEKEIKDKKKEIKAYVHDMRQQLNDKYQEFVIASERDEFIVKLQEVEDWLYEDGKDETVSVYTAKLDELKELANPIEERYKEYSRTGELITELIYRIITYRSAAISNHPKFDHIKDTEKEKVLDKCLKAENWLKEKLLEQKLLPKFAKPALLSTDIRIEAEILARFCKSIMVPMSLPNEADMDAIDAGFEQLVLRDVDGVESDGDFNFTYREDPWIPDVRNQGDTPFCWAHSSTQLFQAVYSFQRAVKGPQVSVKCLINGVAPNALDDIVPKEDPGHYEATPLIAFKFVQERGCDLESNYAYTEAFEVDRPFYKCVEIVGDPFSVDVDASVNAIKAALEDFGPLIGCFEIDDTYEDLENYHGPPKVYWIEADQDAHRDLHWALITGCGRLGGIPFLEIQNSYGVSWCDKGYAYIGLELFHHIHGLRGVLIGGE